MAITFKITNGDVEFNGSTGRPKTLGNDLEENDLVKAKNKATQDIQRSLSLDRISTGDTAAINELAGLEQDGGAVPAQILLNRQIRDMHSNLIRLQRLRSGVRPDNEKFARIVFLQTIRDTDKTTLRFRVDFQTIGGLIVRQTATISNT